VSVAVCAAMRVSVHVAKCVTLESQEYVAVNCSSE